MTPYIVVTTTTDSRDHARAIIDALLAKKLAACIQVIPIDSTYIWEGAVTEAAELQLLIKARTVDYQAIEATIKATHTYNVPQITALPIIQGSAAYLSWINSVTAK